MKEHCGADIDVLCQSKFLRKSVSKSALRLYIYLFIYCSAISHKGVITLLVFLNLMRKSLLVVKYYGYN